MNGRSRHWLSDEELRDLLHLGDPAADGSEPTAVEAATLRREILRRAEDLTGAADADAGVSTGMATSRTSWAGGGRLAFAAVIVAVLVTAALLWNGGGDPTADRRVADEDTSAPAGAVTDAASANDSDPASGASVAEPGTPAPPAASEVDVRAPSPATPWRREDAAFSTPEGGGSEPPVVPSPPSLNATTAELLASAPAPKTEVGRAGAERRRVEFVAPGGTRIIWVLDPDLDLSPRPSGSRVPERHGTD